MKVQLPNGESRVLDDNLPLQDKIRIVEDLTEEWMPIIKLNWHSNSVKYFLDSLANYLIWHKEVEEKGLEDKEILSRAKLEQMHKFKKRSRTVNFTDLTSDQKELLFGEERY